MWLYWATSATAIRVDVRVRWSDRVSSHYKIVTPPAGSMCIYLFLG